GRAGLSLGSEDGGIAAPLAPRLLSQWGDGALGVEVPRRGARVSVRGGLFRRKTGPVPLHDLGHQELAEPPELRRLALRLVPGREAVGAISGLPGQAGHGARMRLAVG